MFAVLVNKLRPVCHSRHESSATCPAGVRVSLAQAGLRFTIYANSGPFCLCLPNAKITGYKACLARLVLLKYTHICKFLHKKREDGKYSFSNEEE